MKVSDDLMRRIHALLVDITDRPTEFGAYTVTMDAREVDEIAAGVADCVASPQAVDDNGIKRIFITDDGDPSVGIGPEEWTLQVPDEFWEVLKMDDAKQAFLDDVRELTEAWMGFSVRIMTPEDLEADRMEAIVSLPDRVTDQPAEITRVVYENIDSLTDAPAADECHRCSGRGQVPLSSLDEYAGGSFKDVDCPDCYGTGKASAEEVK